MPDESPQEVRNKLLQRFSEATGTDSAPSANPLIVTADVILKNLDNQFVFQYIRALETAKKVLKGYLTELESMNKRLAKADSITRITLGQENLDAKKAAIDETLHKLELHQKATQQRLLNG